MENMTIVKKNIDVDQKIRAAIQGMSEDKLIAIMQVVAREKRREILQKIILRLGHMNVDEIVDRSVNRIYDEYVKKIVSDGTETAFVAGVLNDNIKLTFAEEAMEDRDYTAEFEKQVVLMREKSLGLQADKDNQHNESEDKTISDNTPPVATVSNNDTANKTSDNDKNISSIESGFDSEHKKTGIFKTPGIYKRAKTG